MVFSLLSSASLFPIARLSHKCLYARLHFHHGSPPSRCIYTCYRIYTHILYIYFFCSYISIHFVCLLLCRKSCAKSHQSLVNGGVVFVLFNVCSSVVYVSCVRVCVCHVHFYIYIILYMLSWSIGWVWAKERTSAVNFMSFVDVIRYESRCALCSTALWILYWFTGVCFFFVSALPTLFYRCLSFHLCILVRSVSLSLSVCVRLWLVCFRSFLTLLLSLLLAFTVFFFLVAFNLIVACNR